MDLAPDGDEVGGEFFGGGGGEVRGAASVRGKELGKGVLAELGGLGKRGGREGRLTICSS